MSKLPGISLLLMLTVLASPPAAAVRIGDFTPRTPTAPAAITSPPESAPMPVMTPAAPRTTVLTPEPALPQDPLLQKEVTLLRQLDTPPADLDLVFELASLRRERAMQAYQLGEMSLALDLMTNALQLDPNQPAAWETLGDWASELPSPDSVAMAHYAYAEVIQLIPDHPRVHFKLAAITADRGDYPRAIEHFEQALSSDQAALQWNHLALLNTLYLRNDSPVQGMNFLQQRFDSTSDERFLLAEAILMDALGQGESAAKLAGLVASSDTLPAVFRQYAQTLEKKFASAGDQRLYGRTSAGEGWLIDTGAAQ